MSRLVQGLITGEMRLGFLVQDIYTFAFAHPGRLQPDGPGSMIHRNPVSALPRRDCLHSVCPMPMCRKETPPRVPPSF